MRPFIGPALPIRATRESAPGLERTRALRTDWMVSATSHVPHCKRAASTNRSATIVHPNSGRVFQPERSERAQVCKQRDWWIMGMLNRSSRREIGERTKTGSVEVSSALSLGYNVKCSIFSFSFSLSLLLRCWCFVLLPIMHSRLQPREEISIFELCWLAFVMLLAHFIFGIRRFAHEHDSEIQVLLSCMQSTHWNRSMDSRSITHKHIKIWEVWNSLENVSYFRSRVVS